MRQGAKTGVNSGGSTGRVRPNAGASGTAIGFGDLWRHKGWPGIAPSLPDDRNARARSTQDGSVAGRPCARPASRQTPVRCRPGLSAHSGDHVLYRFRVPACGADQPFGARANVRRLVQFGHAGLAFLRPDQVFGGVPQVLLRLFSRAPVLSDAVRHFVRIELAFARFFRPPTPRVARIPQGPLLISPAGSKVVAAEAVDD